jgi:hypothetical protein
VDHTDNSGRVTLYAAAETVERIHTEGKATHGKVVDCQHRLGVVESKIDDLGTDVKDIRAAIAPPKVSKVQLVGILAALVATVGGASFGVGTAISRKADQASVDEIREAVIRHELELVRFRTMLDYVRARGVSP